MPADPSVPGSIEMNFEIENVIGNEASCDLPLWDFVEKYEISVRLRRSINGARASGVLPFKTVGEYKSAGPEAQEIMLREVRNFGRKTARELHDLIKAASELSMEVRPPPHLEKTKISEEIYALPLWDLVENYEATVRLRGSIRSSRAAGSLPFNTVGEYLKAGPAAQRILMSEIRNFGRKTARELEALISAVANPSLELKELRELFDNETLFEIIEGRVLSSRLKNVLSQLNLCGVSFSKVLENFQEITAALYSEPNCASKTVSQFRALCEAHVRSRLAAVGIINTDQYVVWLLGGSPPAQMPRRSIGDVDETASLAHSRSGASIDLDPPEPQTLSVRLEWFLSKLDDRSKLIICRRNGINQERCETFEEIGRDLKVTRERIRQIEVKSLRRMRSYMRHAPISELIYAEADQIWRKISKGLDFLSKKDLPTHRKNLEPFARLALDLEEVLLPDFLDHVAPSYPHGWLAPYKDRQLIDDAGNMLHQLQSLQLPQPISKLGIADLNDALTAAVLILGQNIYCGYLMPTRFGMRLTRLVRLHSVLAGMDQGMSSIESLVRQYRNRFDDDQCSERDAEIVMARMPHLFLEMADGNWFAIGIAGTHLPPLAISDDRLIPGTEDPGTIAHALQATLEERGPTRLFELLNDAEEILPEGRSLNSIAPVLLMRSELFIRALPGVYSLPRHLEEFQISIPEAWPILFNDYQARLYALARYAGEPRTIFPLWSSRVELDLCRWAQHSGGPGIFSSLLSIAVIDDWPISSDVRQEWQRTKVREGRFELGSSLRHEAAYERPALDRVFAACLHASLTGQLNWVAANRLTGRKIDSHGGAGLVALLLRLGVIEEASSTGYRWQRPHRATSYAKQLAAEMGEAFGNADRHVDWQSPIGKFLKSRVLNNLSNDWVDNQAIADMLSQATQSLSFDSSDDDPLSQILEAQRRHREANRREAMLDWLLED